MNNTGEIMNLSSESCIRAYNLNYLDRVSQTKISMIEAFSGKSPQITQLQESFGDQWTIGLLRLWIESIDEYYGKGQFSEYQQKEVASLILSEYSKLKLTELALFIKMFKLGKFKQFYGKIDPQAIMLSLREYISARDNERHHEMNRKRAEEIQGSSNADFIKAAISFKTYEAYRDNFKKQKEAEEAKQLNNQ